MGDSHSGCDSGPPQLPELLQAALECETEGPWVERHLEADASIRESVRQAALAAFDAAALEDLLPDALALETVGLEAVGGETAQTEDLARWQRDAAVAALADADVLDELLEDVLALERATAEQASAARSDAAPAAAVRDAALAAWDENAPAVQEAPVLAFPSERTRVARSEPLRARRMRTPLLLRPYAAAAALLVALGAGLLLFGGNEEAQAGLQLRALSHRNLESTMGMSHIEPRYFAALGRVFAPGDSELLSFGFADEGLVVVGEGDAVRVTRPDTSPAGVAVPEAVLRLESGEARLATRAAPIPLEVDGIGLFVLEEGAAHVALHAEAADGAPAVALAEHSVARFYRADGTSVPLSGPTHVALKADGVKSFGSPARSLFRELAFFGGPLPAATQIRNVPARLFDIRAGAASRGRQDIRVLEADADEPTAVRVAWRPAAVLYDAQRLRVALRAPRGTTVSLAQTGADDLEATVQRDGGSSEPGLSTVEFTLPAAWFERLPKGLLELTIQVQARSRAGDLTKKVTTKKSSTRRRRAVRAWFDGVSLVLGPAEDGLPPMFLQSAKSVLHAKARR